MRKVQKVALAIFFVAVFLSMCALFFINDRKKPIVYKSSASGKIIKVVVDGKEIPPNEFIGTSYHLVWEK